MWKIDRVAAEGPQITLRLIGRLCTENLPELKLQIKAMKPGAVLEMSEVTLVDLEVVRFLGECETQGVQLRRCSRYIREWITRERRPANRTDD
jgi:hypothetical protein